MKIKSVLTGFFSVAILAAACLVSVPAQATMYDYSDAPGYATAKHANASWQRLGKAWDSEAAPKSADTSDDGVSWSVNGGAYGHDTIIAGQTVTFKFDMYKQLWGRHAADHLAVWIDWNHDKDFTDAGEKVFLAAWDFRTESGYHGGNDDYAGISKSFFLSMAVPQDVMLGDTWLRARVVCNFDNPNLNAMSSTGYYGQGEVEDWKLTVAPVPEPSTLILMGLGLGGVALLRRRNKK